MQRTLCFMFLLTTLLPASGRGEIYKCIAPNGDLTYSQTPCRDSKVSTQVAVTNHSDRTEACQHAHRFALATAQEMQAGASSSAVFDRYGGLDEMSRGSIGLISYVYQYRSNHNVSANRIAELSVAKCRARAFGDVGCDQLPAAFTSQLGGCDLGDKSGKPATLPVIRAAPAQSIIEPRVSRATRQAEYREARARDEARRAECRDRIRGQIDSINSRMRSGYTGSQGRTLRDRRRNLERDLREC